jgi:hypothetical protein
MLVITVSHEDLPDVYATVINGKVVNVSKQPEFALVGWQAGNAIFACMTISMFIFASERPSSRYVLLHTFKADSKLKLVGSYTDAPYFEDAPYFNRDLTDDEDAVFQDARAVAHAALEAYDDENKTIVES